MKKIMQSKKKTLWPLLLRKNIHIDQTKDDRLFNFVAGFEVMTIWAKSPENSISAIIVRN
jgi:hypothetical protein